MEATVRVIAWLALASTFAGEPEFNVEERAFQAKWAHSGGSLVWVKESDWMLSLDLTLGESAFDFGELAPLKRLAALRVFKGSVREGTLAKLAGLPKLELLVILSAGVTDRGLAAIARLTRVNKLDVAGPTITSAGLASIAKMPSLRRLFLYNTKIRDEDLGPLERLSKLQDLTLPLTVSEAGLARLKMRLPNARVIRL